MRLARAGFGWAISGQAERVSSGAMPTTIVWGVEASPFVLKLEAMLRFHERPFRRLPAQGGFTENGRVLIRMQRAIRARRVQRYPQMDRRLDEYPGVPFLSEDGRRFHYDSSALGLWLDARSDGVDPPWLFPDEPVLRFVAQLIDEAFDEFGLYMVHHKRWVGSATDTEMGERTAAEFARMLPPPIVGLIRKYLPRRQVRRCPYLFSVAPAGYRVSVERQRIPPPRAGFPPTHALLDESWGAYLASMEELLEAQPYILGDRFTVADASAYGQLSMNLIDPSAVQALSSQAPLTHRWLEAIRDGKHVGSRGDLYLSEAVEPLIEVVMSTFADLMAQNIHAWRLACERGETHFNEAAFDRDRALYDGTLRGHRFRSVVKTFQVRVWQDLQESWRGLSPADVDRLRALIPDHPLFDADPD